MYVYICLSKNAQKEAMVKDVCLAVDIVITLITVTMRMEVVVKRDASWVLPVQLAKVN